MDDQRHRLFEVPLAVADQKGAKLEQFPESRGNSNRLLIASAAASAVVRKGGEEVEFEIAKDVKMKFCWIPPGKATLGSPATEKERSENEKEHDYESKGFWLGKYPVTQGEWTGVMGTTPFSFHKNVNDKDCVKRVEGLDTGRYPAERVSWDEAQEVWKSLNQQPGVAAAVGKAGKFELPHEDQGEYARSHRSVL